MSYFQHEPVAVWNEAQTLAALNDPASFPKRLDKWLVKSQWLCDLLNEKEKAEGFQYNISFQRWFEKTYNVGPFDENGSVLSLLVYNAQKYRRHDALIKEGWREGTDEVLREALTRKRPIEYRADSLFGGVSILKLNVREINGRLYAMKPRARTYGVSVLGQPIRIA